MLLDKLSECTYMIKPGVTDMRGGARILTKRVEEMGANLYDGKTLFMFCSKTKRYIKILGWENGYWLITYQIKGGTFAWPDTLEEATKLKYSDILRILEGQDIFRRVQKVKGPEIF